MGEVAGGGTGQMTRHMRPIQQKLNETMARVSKEYPDRKGMNVAVFACYVPGEVDATRLRGNENCQEIASSNATVTGGKKMVAVIPVSLRQMKDGKRALIGEVRPNALIEIVTIDYAIPDTSQQVYLFGDRRFDLTYIGKLAVFTAIAALESAGSRSDDPLGMIARVTAATAATAFVASLTQVLTEMSSAAGAQGADLVDKSLKALASS
ncbi:MAG: hypothetical protein FJX47_08130 [Alphaproteobacteria bacterium]|nr:hypothetical protein [Alphaproteobacteria bacterium]